MGSLFENRSTLGSLLAEITCTWSDISDGWHSAGYHVPRPVHRDSLCPLAPHAAKGLLVAGSSQTMYVSTYFRFADVDMRYARVTARAA